MVFQGSAFCYTETGTLSPTASYHETSRESWPLSPNLWTLLTNADEIMGKFWKIRKNIDNSLDNGIIVLKGIIPTSIRKGWWPSVYIRRFL